MKYFIMENGKGAYCEGEDLWDPTTCIEVPKRPFYNWVWNNTTKVWEETLEGQRAYIKPLVEVELKRTDKYFLEDNLLTSEEKVIAGVYRQDLRDLPTKTVTSEIVMPTCPSFMIN
jgi:hypothetical protein